MREKTVEIENMFLSPYAKKSEDTLGRAREEEPCPMRTDFQRGRDNHIVIPEGYVSHHHAQIYRHGNQYVIEDLGSINHTYVNGQILEGRAYLRPGDKIRIGLVTLRFER